MKLTHKKSKYFKTAQEEMIDLCKKKNNSIVYHDNILMLEYYCE